MTTQCLYKVLVLPGHGVDWGGEGLPLIVEEVEHNGVQHHAHQPNLQDNEYVSTFTNLDITIRAGNGPY